MMCSGSGFSSAKFNPASLLLKDKFKLIDPIGAKLERAEKKAFAAPTFTPPPPPQDMKTPDMASFRQKRTNNTLLTGSGGLSAGSFNTGGSTLLGG
jgi:hypothetical protein